MRPPSRLALPLLAVGLLPVAQATPQFGSPEELSLTLPGCYDLEAADLDGDGDLDVVAPSASDGVLGLFENAGGGSFLPMRVFGEGTAYFAQIHAVDVDGDGVLDVLSLEHNGWVRWRRGLGSLDYGAPVDIGQTPGNGRSLVWADLGGSSLPDVVVAAHVGSLQWFPNLGGGQFGPAERVGATGDFVTDVVVGDTDGDGDGDLVLGRANPYGIARRENLGGGVFGPEQMIDAVDFSNDDPELVDLDQDGDLDLVATKWVAGQIVWYENPGNGAFEPAVALTSGIGLPRVVRAVDVDGDSDPDIVFGPLYNSEFALGWIENLGGAAFSAPRRIRTGLHGGLYIEVADLSGDGLPEVLMASAASSVIFLPNAGAGAGQRFADPRELTRAVIPAEDVIAADLDADGDLDMVAAASATDRVSWFENLGGGQFGLQASISEGLDGASRVMSEDLDGDGVEDLVVWAEDAGEVHWVRSMGGGGFAQAVRLATLAPGDAEVLSDDINGDGRADIVLAPASGGVVWIQGLGGGAFAAAQVLVTPTSVTVDAELGDIDADGRVDLTLLPAAGGPLVWHRNLGNAQFDAPRSIGGAFGEAQGSTLADLNGDGFLDAIWSSDRKVRWAPFVQPAGFGVPELLDDRSHRQVCVQSADYDADGDLDVVTLHWIYEPSEPTHVLIENLGGGVFAAPRNGGFASAGAFRFEMDDLDGDGDVDLLLPLKYRGKVVVRYGTRFSTFGVPLCGPGVPNSSGRTGRMLGVGSNVAAENDARLVATGLPPGALSLVLTSLMTTAPRPLLGSQGLACFGSPVGRFVSPGQVGAASPDGRFELTPDLAQLPLGGAIIAAQPGESWFFQTWHRDSAGGTATTNLTEGVSVTWK